MSKQLRECDIHRMYEIKALPLDILEVRLRLVQVGASLDWCAEADLLGDPEPVSIWGETAWEALERLQRKLLNAPDGFIPREDYAPPT